MVVSVEPYCHLQNGKIFKMAQYALRAVFGSLSLLARRSCYFNLEELIAFDVSSVIAFKDV